MIMPQHMGVHCEPEQVPPTTGKCRIELWVCVPGGFSDCSALIYFVAKFPVETRFMQPFLSIVIATKFRA